MYAGDDSQGIRIANGAHHIRIKNVEIKNHNFTGITIASGDNRAGDFHEFIDLHIHDNGIDRFDHGIYPSGGSFILIEGCDIHTNSGYGIHVWTTEGGGHTIRNNKIYDNGTSVGPSGSFGMVVTGPDHLIYNNIIYNHREGDGSRGGIAVGSETRPTPNTRIFNNVIVGNAKKSGISINPSASETLIRNNVIIGQGLSLAIDDHGIDTIQSHNHIDEFDGDPLFLDLDNFRPQSNSPLIDQGLCEAEVTTDFDGNPRAVDGNADGFNECDIGAFEYSVQDAGGKSFCGDATCSNDSLEDCTSCPDDCGACPTSTPFCGDATCDPDETCESCPHDCNVCPEQCINIDGCTDGDKCCPEGCDATNDSDCASSNERFECTDGEPCVISASGCIANSKPWFYVVFWLLLAGHRRHRLRDV
ncbi:MAG: right-handed parallel beta-helix repeat-containing protein [Myxococcota bacterium]